MSQDKLPTHVKSFEAVEIKDESTGEVEAIIATLGVVDRDREVITANAIKNGARVRMSAYGHDMVGFLSAGAAPVGKGTVVIEGDKAIFRGKMFMSTTRGRETLSVLKEMGTEQEWSFGFHVLEDEPPDEEWAKKGAERVLTKLDVFEVSPVMIGAGIGTRTVAAKEADEEAARAKAEEEAKQQAEAEAAAKAAEEEAARLERAAASAAEAQALLDEAEAAAKAEADAREAEAKEREVELARKARAAEAMEEYQRVRRSLRRMGLSG